MTSLSRSFRRGITLLEVLIAIGILAVGLTSVVALVPAGHASAGKAVTFDRANALAQNALNDAATFGLLKLTTLGIASGTSATPLIIDTQPTAVLLGGSAATPRTLGIYATGTEAVASDAFVQLFTQMRDDLALRAQADEDAPPVYTEIDGTRGFEGRFSCLYALSPLAVPLTAGAPARLSVVVFHNRAAQSAAASDLVITGSWQANYSLAFTPPADRKPAECLHAGTVLLAAGQFYQVRSATFDHAGQAQVLLSGTTMFSSGTATILLDSVGLAERTVTLEGSGPFSQ